MSNSKPPKTFQVGDSVTLTKTFDDIRKGARGQIVSTHKGGTFDAVVGLSRGSTATVYEIPGSCMKLGWH